MTQEIWKTIPGFEDYEASDQGRIRSKSRMRYGKNDQPMPMRGRVLTEMVQSGRGYKRVNLYRGKRMSQHGVHRLVARAFLGEPNGLSVNHIDCDVSNNSLDNLEYVTPAENSRHASEHGRLPGFPGESNPRARLSVADVQAIAFRIRNYERDLVIGRDFGVAKGTITAIRLGKIWAHVTGFNANSYRVVRGRRKARHMRSSGKCLKFIEFEDRINVARYVLVGA